MQPAGVQGTSARASPTASSPALTGWKPVDVFRRRDGVQDAAGVYVIGQRQLHEDAVDLPVRVERLDQTEQIGLARRVGQIMLDGMEAAALRCPALRP